MSELAEILAKIEEIEKSLIDYIAHLNKLINADSHKTEPDWALVQYLDIAENSLKAVRALKVAVEKHANDGGNCAECSCYYSHGNDRDEMFVPYPCPFIIEIHGIVASK